MPKTWHDIYGEEDPDEVTSFIRKDCDVKMTVEMVETMTTLLLAQIRLKLTPNRTRLISASVRQIAPWHNARFVDAVAAFCDVMNKDVTFALGCLDWLLRECPLPRPYPAAAMCLNLVNTLIESRSDDACSLSTMCAALAYCVDVGADDKRSERWESRLATYLTGQNALLAVQCMNLIYMMRSDPTDVLPYRPRVMQLAQKLLSTAFFTQDFFSWAYTTLWYMMHFAPNGALVQYLISLNVDAAFSVHKSSLHLIDLKVCAGEEVDMVKEKVLAWPNAKNQALAEWVNRYATLVVCAVQRIRMGSWPHLILHFPEVAHYFPLDANSCLIWSAMNTTRVPSGMPDEWRRVRRLEPWNTGKGWGLLLICCEDVTEPVFEVFAKLIMDRLKKNKDDVIGEQVRQVLEAGVPVDRVARRLWSFIKYYDCVNRSLNRVK